MATVKKKTKKKTKNQFQTGHKKSVGFGRPKMSEEEKELSLKSRTQLKTIINKYMITNQDDLEKLIKDKTLPIIDGMLIRSLLNAFKSGNQSEINWFLDHSLGKAKDETHINLRGTMENTNTVNLKKLSKEQLLQLKDVVESSEGNK